MIQTSDMMLPNLTPSVVNIPNLWKKNLFNIDKGFYN